MPMPNFPFIYIKYSFSKAHDWEKAIRAWNESESDGTEPEVSSDENLYDSSDTSDDETEPCGYDR